VTPSAKDIENAALYQEWRRILVELHELRLERDTLRSRRGRTATRLRRLRRRLALLTDPRIPTHAEMVALLGRVTRERDALHSVLAPLLDGDWRIDVDIGQECLFCAAPVTALPGRDTADHAPTCPVLRRAVLLGREAT